MPEFISSGLDLPWVVEVIALGALYGLVSRVVGKGVNRARSIGFPAVLAASAVLCGTPGALMGLGWCFTRSADLKPHDATPTKLKHFLSASLRLIPVFIAAGLVTWLFEQPSALVAAVMIAVAQLAWAGWYGDENDDARDEGRSIDPRANIYVEWGQGIAAGAAVAFSLGVGA